MYRAGWAVRPIIVDVAASSTRTAIQRRSCRNAPNLFKGKGCLGGIAEIVSSANAVIHGRRLQEDAPPVGIRKRKVFRKRLKSCVPAGLGRDAATHANLPAPSLTARRTPYLP
jgi:hypothetical protein